jgi:hypothetical protein
VYFCRPVRDFDSNLVARQFVHDPGRHLAGGLITGFIRRDEFAGGVPAPPGLADQRAEWT